MRRRICTLAAALLAAWPSGCSTTPKANPYPSDPLLVSKKPVEVKPANVPPTRVAYWEPDAPPVPQFALAVRTVSAP
jgi:hypothetical protein